MVTGNNFAMHSAFLHVRLVVICLVWKLARNMCFKLSLQGNEYNVAVESVIEICVRLARVSAIQSWYKMVSLRDIYLCDMPLWLHTYILCTSNAFP